MHTLDMAVIGAYLVALVAIALRSAGKQRTTQRYFLADRSIPGWATGMSLLATIITSVTFIAYPGAAFAGNWNLLVPGIFFLAVIVAIGPVIVPFFRHTVSMSVYEYFGKRFGTPVRLYASFAFAVGHFAKMGFVFYLLSLSVSAITGWPIASIILVLGSITIFYTLLGGLEAVIWTDVLQGFVLWVGVLVTIGLLLFSPKVHPGAMLHLIAANHKTSLGSMHFNLSLPTFWTLAIYGIFFYLQKYTTDQTVVQRYLAARTDRQAIRGAVLGASLCLPAWTAFMIIGSLLWAFYKLTAQTLPANITRPDQIFPHFMVTQMPIGVGGLFLAALLGAAMSMLASDLNCLAVILITDFYETLCPNRPDRFLLRIAKVSIALCGILAMAVALRLAQTHGSALALYYAVTAVVAGGLAGLYLFAFLLRRANPGAALSGIAANLIFTVWATLTMNHGAQLDLHRWNYPWHEYTIGAVGNLLLLVVGTLTIPLFKSSQTTTIPLTLWDWLAAKREPATQYVSAGER